MRTHIIYVDPYGRVILDTHPDGNRPGAENEATIFPHRDVFGALTALLKLLDADEASLARPLPRIGPEIESDFRYGGTDPDGEAA